MVKLASYFVNNDQNLQTDQKNIIKGKKYRFSILTPRLIRIEYNENGVFEDRATSLVISILLIKHKNTNTILRPLIPFVLSNKKSPTFSNTWQLPSPAVTNIRDNSSPKVLKSI